MITRSIRVAVLLMIAGCDEPAPVTYANMDFEERVAFMNEVVLPEMQPVFERFDAKFAGMSCATCHGDGASDGTYAMPNPQLPRLPPSEEAFAEYLEDPEHARWSQFMIDDVWPQMADLLELPMFDPVDRPMGFSCSNCHLAEGQ